MKSHHEKIEEWLELEKNSTRVNAWYPHGPEGGDRDKASVRGPFCRWLEVSEVDPAYKKHVADAVDDAKYAAASMNVYSDVKAYLQETDERIAALRDAILMGSDNGVFWREKAITADDERSSKC